MSAPDTQLSQPIAGYHCDAGLGIIHLADGRGNRLNSESLLSLKKALATGIADAHAKILMIRSGEESFCLGMDLQGLESSLEGEGSSSLSAEHAESERAAAVSLYSELLYSIVVCSKPVVALVEGDVKAGGVGLVSACDIVISTEHASFELSELLFALVPYNVLPYVFELRMSPQRFRYLVLSASRLDAAEAEHFGLVDRVYPAGELEKNLRSFFKTMMRTEPRALAAAKAFFVETLSDDFTQRRKKAETALLGLMKQPQVQEGLQAFHLGQTPSWFQRFKPGILSGRER